MPILNGSLQTGLAALTRCVHERGQIQGEEGFCHARTVWRSVVRSSESVHRPRIRLASGRNSSWRSRNGVSEATHPSEGNAVLLRRGTKSYATCTDVSVINHAVLMVPSIPRVDELVKAMGISKGRVSRLCAEIDERVQTFLRRPIEGEWPSLWLDATYVKARREVLVVIY